MQPMVSIALRVLREAGQELVHAAERFDFDRATDQEISKFIADCSIGTEKQIIFKMRKHFPDDNFLGRETGSQVRSEETPTTWHVHALEGAENFRTGLPLYSMVLVCMVDGKAQHALIVNPATGEEFTASRGRGAELSGRRIRTGEKTKLSQTVLAVKYPGIADNERNVRLRERIMNLSTQTRLIRALGDDALTLAYTASGQVDASWISEADDMSLQAGILIAKEAGCLMTDFSGGPDFETQRDVICSNPKLLKSVLKGSL